MGLIGAIFGNPAATASIGQAAAQVVETFTPNATKQMELTHDAYIASLNEFAEENRVARTGIFDRFVDGLNRLPRPMLAFGTLALFVYAMVDPAGFSLRMQGLNYIPDPLWWLLAAIVGFYFGAREAHYLRGRIPKPKTAAPRGQSSDQSVPQPVPVVTPRPDGNAALDDWRSSGTAAH
jgi:hypothetical protein